jgi:hypothetical protein
MEIGKRSTDHVPFDFRAIDHDPAFIGQVVSACLAVDESTSCVVLADGIEMHSDDTETPATLVLHSEFPPVAEVASMNGTMVARCRNGDVWSWGDTYLCARFLSFLYSFVSQRLMHEV